MVMGCKGVSECNSLEFNYKLGIFYRYEFKGNFCNIIKIDMVLFFIWKK